MEKIIADFFAARGWTWSLAGRGSVVPVEEDIEAALDEAARILYNEPVGATLEVGRLIIQKKHRGHDVYMYVGPYE